jgi:5-formyltetrahydrofolate cyclo-ligase
MDSHDALRADKAELRKRLLESRRGLGRNEIELAGLRSAELVAETPEFERAEALILYAATPDEMPTRPLYELAVQAGKATIFPRCQAGQQLDFVLVEAWRRLAPGRFGLLEPEPGLPRAAVDVADLVIVPGVAFDRAGGRLGRGQGYYDRAFPTGKSAPALFGYAFDLQILDAVPMDSLDRRMDAIVSEAGILRVDASGPD